ncbi:uncharacterized protein PFL1_00087 [Pseudozyma flocculosa PF-1]|uniref:Related to DUF567 domain protein n=1 Tax=Pseudozyma flocculosa TaxID=84751 RepID=A0A5C3ESB3_9BASI|nr:uncharacterized protein PFL1_00087 [Pseudozyma flocculosa PF-1]EPQ31888.1 hypothetical protein PFL1_00087 [Pseudozyma flocculosa PF-1]SPO35203.1 related to DUF567 domain protein [Pseudozyma flocculosa]
MGFLSNLAGKAPGAAAPLAPVPRPIGVIPHFTQHSTQIALQVREQKMSMSGDDFSVKDAVTGNTMFKVDGSYFSMRDKKNITDASGNPLFTVKKKLIAIHSTYVGTSPKTDDVIFTVKSSFSLGTKLTATFKNVAGDGQETELVLRGDLLDRSAEITTKDGIPVARIARSFVNAGELLFDKQTYVLTVAPGVDAALLLAICICLDEKANEK